MYLEEGRRIREAAEIEKARLASIKARKLKDLEDAGESTGAPHIALFVFTPRSQRV